MKLQSLSLSAAAALFAGSLLGSGQAHAANECAKFGNPTYEADRHVQIGGESFRSRVYVAGDLEREELSRGGRTEVIILARGEVITFDPQAKIGTRRSVGAAPKPRTESGSIRAREEDAGGNKRLLLEARNDSGGWTVINEVVCRSDGAVLSKKSSIPINGAMVATSMSQQVRSAGGIDRSMFSPPGDIRFQR